MTTICTYWNTNSRRLMHPLLHKKTSSLRGKTADHVTNWYFCLIGYCGQMARFLNGCDQDVREARRRWDITRKWREDEGINDILSEFQACCTTCAPVVYAHCNMLSPSLSMSRWSTAALQDDQNDVSPLCVFQKQWWRLCLLWASRGNWNRSGMRVQRTDTILTYTYIYSCF